MTDGSGQTPPPQQFPPPAGQPVQPPPAGQPVQPPPAGQVQPPSYTATPAPGSPGTGYDYGAPPPVAEPPKKGSRKVLYIVLAVILLPILGIGGCTAAIFYAAKAPIDTTNDFLAVLDEQRYDDAYDALVPGCMVLNREDFVSAMSAVDITGYNINSFESSGSSATTSGTITLGPEGTEHPIRFDLRKVDGSWSVCTFDFDFDPVGE